MARDSQYQPVLAWMGRAPTDEQIRADVLGALDDPRISEAFKMLRVVAHGVPFATAIAAVFRHWDSIDRRAKVDGLAEMMGWCDEWLEADSLVENVTAWERPWDDMREGDHA